jgi:hypothetical protein
VNLDALINRALVLIDQTSGIKTGQSQVYAKGLENVAQGKTVRVTMAFTDAPAAASVAKAPVNDLDLVVLGPDGTRYFPNHLNGPDKINNVEMVEFIAPAAGKYQIVVNGVSVPVNSIKGGQPYALAWEAL